KDVVPFSVADMEFKNAPEIIEGLKKRLDNLVLGYCSPTDRFYNSIINWDKKHHDADIKKEWIVEVPTVVDGFFAAVSAFTKKGDSVMIMRPVYGPFRFAIEFNERVMADVPLISDERNNYSIDFEKFESECKKSENKMVILCNPHNPGGILWSKDDLEKVIKIANDNDVIVVVDEIWQDIVMPGNTHTSVLSLDRKLVEKAVVCQSSTKSFNLAGLCCGYTIISDPEMMVQYKKTLDIMRSNTVNVMGLEATQLAFDEAEDWLNEMIKVIDTNQKIVYDFFQEKYPKIIVNHLQATYVMWMDFRCLGLNSDDLLKTLGEKADLVFTDGRFFGECDGFVRFNVAAPTQVVKDALVRLDNLLQETYK
ncbi:MAG: PatB family C-S lyase, partial [Finegoldia magna]|nr:PatB family C-S lyase [Finegoldia magna]